MKKLLVSDFDNTLCIDNEIDEIDISKIKLFRKKKNIFVIASGRSLDEINPTIKEFDLDFDYLILNHGAVIINKKGLILGATTIRTKVLNKLNDELVNYKKFIKESNYFDIISGEPKEMNNITKIRLRIDNFKNGEHICTELNKIFLGTLTIYLRIKKRKIFIEIIPYMINKQQAIELIQKFEKIDKANIYTIGDGISDLEMIKKYNGFAVVEADIIIKRNAKEVFNNVYELIEKITK